jgi:hypothetical protein
MVRSLALFAMALLLVVPASAQDGKGSGTLLRWKLSPGKTMILTSTQNVDMAVAGMKQKIETESNLSVKVVEEVDSNHFKIESAIERLKMDMTLPPPIGKVSIDSDSDEAPSSPFLGPVVENIKKSVKQPATAVVSLLGETSDIKLPEAAAAQGPGAPALQDMMKSVLMRLPDEAVRPGSTWTEVVENNAQGAAMKVTNDYTYKGTEEVDGKTLERIEVVSKIEMEANEQIKLGETESSGWVLFDNELGRLHSSEIQQTINLQVSAQGQKMDQKMMTTTKVTVTDQ